MVPARPDIAGDKPAGEASPEYEAFELCGPKEILCISSVGPWESVGGDIKFLRLKQLAVGGLVTDGSVRDTDEILNYGFPCFSHSTTAKQGPAAMQPWEAQGVIEMGQTNPVVVRPGDAIVADQDGVVVVPAAVAEKVYEIAHFREHVEGIIKEELIKSEPPTCGPSIGLVALLRSAVRPPLFLPGSPRIATCSLWRMRSAVRSIEHLHLPLPPTCRALDLRPSLASDPGPPGKYYPFKPPIKPESPLGKLLTSKGVKYYSTSAGRRGSSFGSGRRNMSTVPATMKVA